MSKKRNLLILAAITTALGLSLSQYGFADNSSGNSNSSSSGCCQQTITVLNEINNTVSSGFKTVIGLVNQLVATTLDFQTMIQGNNGLKTLAEGNYVTRDSAFLSGEYTANMLLSSSQQIQTINQDLASLIPARNADNSQNQANKQTLDSLRNFELSQALNTATMSQDQQQQAQKAIQFLAGSVPPPLDTNYLRLNTSGINNYKVTLGSVAATQNLALIPLNNAIILRSPQKGLGDFMGKGQNSSASPMELQQYMATLPLSSQWAGQLATGTAADRQMAIVYLLASINYQLYNTQRILEQGTLVQSANLLQAQNVAMRERLEKLRSDAIQSVAQQQ